MKILKNLINGLKNMEKKVNKSITNITNKKIKIYIFTPFYKKIYPFHNSISVTYFLKINFIYKNEFNP